MTADIRCAAVVACRPALYVVDLGVATTANDPAPSRAPHVTDLPEQAKQMRREWQSPNGRWWIVSLHFPGIENLAAPPPAPPPSVKPAHLRFTDRDAPGWRYAVPFHEYGRRKVADLTDVEVSTYWRRLVEEKPDFGERGGV